jgi:hypothetical protein
VTPAQVSAAANQITHSIMNNFRAPAASFSGAGFLPRADRASQMPNAANAQGIFSPDALIFVAK